MEVLFLFVAVLVVGLPTTPDSEFKSYSQVLMTMNRKVFFIGCL
jgi:hypothetical protein